MRATTISVAVTATPTEVAAHFGPGHATVTRIVRRRTLGRDPYTVMSAYLPQSVAARLGPDGLQSDSLPMALEQAGMMLMRAEHAITATVADDLSATQLQVPVGAPLIAMRTTAVLVLLWIVLYDRKAGAAELSMTVRIISLL